MACALTAEVSPDSSELEIVLRANDDDPRGLDLISRPVINRLFSDCVPNRTDDRTYLIDTPRVQAHPRFRGFLNDSIQSNQKHHRHAPAHFRSETAKEIH